MSARIAGYVVMWIVADESRPQVLRVAPLCGRGTCGCNTKTQKTPVLSNAGKRPGTLFKTLAAAKRAVKTAARHWGDETSVYFIQAVAR